MRHGEVVVRGMLAFVSVVILDDRAALLERIRTLGQC